MSLEADREREEAIHVNILSRLRGLRERFIQRYFKI